MQALTLYLKFLVLSTRIKNSTTTEKLIKITSAQKHMGCEMCGKSVELFNTNVEEVVMKLCRPCSRFGKAVRTQKKIILQKKNPSRKMEVIESLVPNAAKLVKNAREGLGLKQVELAKRIAERESIIQKIESGSFRPSTSLIKKLEKTLKITLLEKVKEEIDLPEEKSTKTGALTIADLMKN